MLAYSLQVRLAVPRQDTGPYQTMALTQVQACTGVASWSWITPADTAVDLRLGRWSSCGGSGSSEAQGDDLRGLD